MNYQLIPKELRPIAEKVEAQQRVSEADALALYRANDLNALGGRYFNPAPKRNYFGGVSIQL